MSSRSRSGSKELGEAIRNRREGLGLTIGKASEKAHVSAKTWSRYESGEAIRKDKVPGVLKALNWKALPEADCVAIDDLERFVETVLSMEMPSFEVNESHEAWSPYLEKTYGPCAASMFAAGSDLVYDYAKDDLEELASRPRGTHLGEVFSMLDGMLPIQFAMRYDYEFVYAFFCAVEALRRRAKKDSPIRAHTVMEELAVSAIIEAAEIFSDSEGVDFSSIDDECPEGLYATICGDDDLHMWLYSASMGPIPSGHPYHFDCWLDRQFYCGSGAREDNIG